MHLAQITFYLNINNKIKDCVGIQVMSAIKCNETITGNCNNISASASKHNKKLKYYNIRTKQNNED
jgi:hypothetical protein